ncbi:MAG: hypothetical protein JRF33_12035 [Deltaproteobacteria bacterium]|nr:hypothetical protein [Deltaproteobacteria bacterium]
MMTRISAACMTLLMLAGPSQADVRPLGCNQPTTSQVVYDANEHRYSLTAIGAQTIRYTLDLDDADLQAGMLRVTASINGGEAKTVMAEAGTRYRDISGQIMEPETVAPGANAALVEHGLDQDVLLLRWQEQPGAHALEKTFRLRLSGYSLQIKVESSNTWGLDGYAGFSMGHAENVPGSRVVYLPFLPEPIALLPDGMVMTAYIDPTVSSAVQTGSQCGTHPDGRLLAHGWSLSLPDTAGVSAPLCETCHLTVSQDLIDVFPAVSGPPSPYRQSLSPLLILDVWGLHRAYSVKEGVALVWESPESGSTHLNVRYADSNPNCGDGVVIRILHKQALLATLPIANGETSERTFERQISLAEGDILRFEIDRAGDNSCDATLLKVDINTPSSLYDSVADFSSSQGQRGFFYREFTGDNDQAMTWDPNTSSWLGEGAFAILHAGGGHPGLGKTSYLDAGQMVKRYVEYGLAKLAIIFHAWQRWGYDAGLPDHHPADPTRGASQEMTDFVQEARDAGMLISLHENYTDIYPDNAPEHPSPLWDPSAIAVNAAGGPKMGWFNETTSQQAFVIEASRMNGFSLQESASIADEYSPNSAYLDVTTGWPPGRAIDHDATRNAVPTLAFAHEATVLLFSSIKAIYQGPLLGEGGEGLRRFDSYFAGHVDGVERQVEGRSRGQLVPDYELLAVKPRMFNHGMGYYGRYFIPAGNQNPELSQVDLDQYRATEIAFGHAGFLGDGILGVGNWLQLHAPEYWLVQALQSRYADAELSEVAYFDGASFIDLERALRTRQDLSSARIRISYANGLTLFVNRQASSKVASSTGDFSHEQGLGGWRYFEDLGAGPVEMSWDPMAQRWQGAGTYSLLDREGGHPDGGAVERRFSVAADATLLITGGVSDANLNCGDGVFAQVLHNSTLLWSCDLPGDTAQPCPDFSFQAQANLGDEIVLRIEEKSNNACDSTHFFANISWDDGQNHDWLVQGPDGTKTLPPSGFWAYQPESFQAYSARPAGEPSAIEDCVRAPEYRFARSRDGTLRQIDGLSTDGFIAIVPGTFGLDLHAMNLTMASEHGSGIITSSVPADVNLRFLDDRNAIVCIRNPATGVTTDLGWQALPDAWRDFLQTHPDALEVMFSDEQGTALGNPSPVALDADGNPLLPGLAMGVTYLLRMNFQTGTVDAGIEDAGIEDAGTEDAGTEDAGTEDAGIEDAGTEDAGSDRDSQTSGGCGCQTDGTNSPSAFILAALFLLLFFRRARALGQK